MISIIIPIYNKINTICKLLDELSDQVENVYGKQAESSDAAGDGKSFPVEILLIDDKSTDDTVNAIKHRNLKPYIRLIECEKNGGPSTARNIGINEAVGDYILFIDADDSLDKDYLSWISTECSRKTSDLTVFSFSEDYLDEKKELSHRLDRIADDAQYVKADDIKGFAECIITLEEKTMLGYPWNKIYKKEIIDKFDIKFPEELRFGEDIFFNCKYLEHVGSIKTVSKQLYRYNNYTGVRLTGGKVDGYFDIQKRRVEAIKTLLEGWKCLDDRAKNVLAAEFFRSFTSEIARCFKQGKTKSEVSIMCENTYNTEIFETLKSCINDFGAKKKMLYGPLAKRKTDSAMRRARLIVFLQTRMPGVFLRAKGKI